MGKPQGDLDQRCAEVAERLIARHDWQLLDRAEFARRIHEALPEYEGDEAQYVARELQYAAFGAYNQALYRACSGIEGERRRERAYEELFHEVYARAVKFFPEVAEDAAQQAIVEVITRFGRCREPKAFLTFAFDYLRGAARALRRREGRETSLERKVGEDGVTLGDVLPAPTDVEADALEREQRLALHSFLASFVQRNPRASKQVDAVVMKFLHGLDDEYIGAALGVSVPNVHVLRSRGLHRLRSEPGWSMLWERYL